MPIGHMLPPSSAFAGFLAMCLVRLPPLVPPLGLPRFLKTCFLTTSSLSAFSSSLVGGFIPQDFPALFTLPFMK